MSIYLFPALAVLATAQAALPEPALCPNCSGAGARPVAHLRDARSAHTATLLPSGAILLAGGMRAGGALASAELFDPRTNTVHPAGSLRTARAGHTATLLRDGSVLMAGGIGHGWTFLASAEVYDPGSGRSAPVGPMTVARESHTAAALPDGRVLIAGGHRGRREALELYAIAELYDPTSRSFLPTGDLTMPRHKHDAVSLRDGRVLILAGSDRTDRVRYTSTELYDPVSGRFARGPDLRFARHKISGASVLLRDGRVLIGGGSRFAEVSDADLRAFHPVPGDLGAELSFATTTLAADGDVILIGGYDERNVSAATVWRIRPPQRP